MSEEKAKPRLEEGPPIWVESCMTAQEHREAHKKYPNTVTRREPVLYNPSYHKGGKWRNGMGYVLSAEEIKNINGNIDYLLKNVKK